MHTCSSGSPSDRQTQKEAPDDPRGHHHLLCQHIHLHHLLVVNSLPPYPHPIPFCLTYRWIVPLWKPHNPTPPRHHIIQLHSVTSAVICDPIILTRTTHILSCPSCHFLHFSIYVQSQPIHPHTSPSSHWPFFSHYPIISVLSYHVITSNSFLHHLPVCMMHMVRASVSFNTNSCIYVYRR